MATVSSHILDSVRGTHAAGIRCRLYRLGESPQLIFDVTADDEGRIVEDVNVDESHRGDEFELVLSAAEYFGGQGMGGATPVEKVVIRFVIADIERRYHLPVMLSPHSYSTWWSG